MRDKHIFNKAMLTQPDTPPTSKAKANTETACHALTFEKQIKHLHNTHQI